MSPRTSTYPIPIPQSHRSPSSRMDSRNAPSQRHRSNRHSATSSGSLRLPSLPRFHPANFPSQHTSAANTPVTGPNSPQPPLSPLAQQRQYSDAQKQLYLYQRELLAGVHNRPTTASGAKPASPRLIPMGSPGPVTPLELEGHGSSAGGYLMAGGSNNSASPSELVEKLIQQEAKRLGTHSPPRPSSAVASR